MKMKVFSRVRQFGARLSGKISNLGSFEGLAASVGDLKAMVPRKDVIKKLSGIPRQLISGPRNIKQLFLLSGRYGQLLARYVGVFSVLLWLYLFYIGRPLLMAAMAFGYLVAVIYTATLVNPLEDSAEFDYELAAQFVGCGALIRIGIVVLGFGAVAKLVSEAAFFTAVISFFVFMGLVFMLLVAYSFQQLRESKYYRKADASASAD